MTEDGNPFALEPRGFYRHVWRFNAVAIAVAAVMGIIVMAPGVYRVLTGEGQHRAHRPRNVIDVSLIGTDREKWRMGHARPLHPTDITMIPLESYYDRYTQAHRNSLLIDARADSTTWLLPTNNHLIARVHHTSRSSDDGQRLAAPFLHQVVRSDTNGDGNLSEFDRSDILVTRFDALGIVKAVQDVDRFHRSTLVDGHLLLFYGKEGKSWMQKLRLEDLTTVATEVLDVPEDPLP